MSDGNAALVSRLLIPPRDARSSWWVPRRAPVARGCAATAPQVADMNCWSLRDPRERFYTSKTRLSTYPRGTCSGRTCPILRPLATDRRGCHSLRRLRRRREPASTTSSGAGAIPTRTTSWRRREHLLPFKPRARRGGRRTGRG